MSVENFIPSDAYTNNIQFVYLILLRHGMELQRKNEEEKRFFEWSSIK